MRADSAAFAAYNEAPVKSPRYVIAHIFDVASVYCTSHDDIPSVPGVVIENVVRDPSAISQRIVPDEGRSEIGSFSYRILDLDSAFTDEARDKLLNDDKSFRGKQVKLYVGYEGMDFTDFQLFQTQIIKDISFEDGVYEISCSDITREQREEIFDPKKTTLRDSVDDSTGTIPVYSTSGFELVFHGPSYSDGPNASYIYFKLENEAIRATGKTSDTFTGCTRGVLNTKAVPHTVDAGTDAERRPKVEEIIYLELPGPKLAYAIMTGVIHGDAATLPDHWHCGIDTDLVRLTDFTGIGRDLWDTALDTSGFVMHFVSLTKINAKKFLESEIYQLLGCYSPIYSDGTIGLKRMNAVLADAAYVIELNETNVVSAGALEHKFSGMHNRLRIDWNWNGKEFTRPSLFIDTVSVLIHKEAELKKLQFKGLNQSRHTESIIRTRMDAFRDRYSAPPETISVRVMPSIDRLEVGDIVRLRLANVRDFAGVSASIDRSFEIQRKSQAHADGDVSLDLFGSTAPASVFAPNTATTAIPDAFYTATGTNLTSVCTIVVVGSVGVIQPGTYNLTGNADMNASGAVYYYNGELQLANGATLTVNNNVQIRAKGFFTINGTIDGVGRGKAGVADGAGWNVTTPGLSGFVGHSRGMDGVAVLPQGFIAFNAVKTQPAALTQGLYSTFPFIEVKVSGSSLLGVPADLRGTSGGGGGKLGKSTSKDFSGGNVTSLGGTGANSGAGLCIIARGIACGGSASIDLSGNDAAATSAFSNPWGQGGEGYAGAGGAGGPGALLMLIDGSSQTFPDLGGVFVAATGSVPINGNTLPKRHGILGPLSEEGWVSPVAGYVDEAIISDVDLSNVAYRIQYIPGVETPADDEDPRPAAPSSISVVGGERIITVRVTPTGPLGPTDAVEIYASIDNDRANSVRIAWGSITEFTHDLPSGGTRFYWTRIRREVQGPDIFSEWLPSSASAGVSTFALDIAGELPSKTGVFLDTFDHQDYARFYELRAGSPIVSYPGSGETGGRAIRMENYGWISWKKNIPFDPNALYVMSGRARMVTAPTGGVSTQDKFFLGVEAIAADGTTLLDISGGSGFTNAHFFAADTFDMGTVSLGDWVLFRGYLSGFNTTVNIPSPGIDDPSHLYNSTAKFIRPVMVMNYSGGNGIMEADYIRIDQVILDNRLGPTAASDPFVTVEPSDGSQAYSSATQPVIEVSGLSGLASYTSPSSRSTEVRASWSGQANISNTTSGAAVGEARITVRVFINSVEVWSQWQVLEGYTGSTDWASFSGTRDFTVPAGQQIDLRLQTGRVFSTSGSSPAQTMFWREALLNLKGSKS